MGVKRQQQSELFRLWLNAGLNPEDFNYIDTNPDRQNAAIHFKPNTDYHFSFERMERNPLSRSITPDLGAEAWFHIDCSPGTQKIRDIKQIEDHWGAIIFAYVEWLENLVLELREPNYWDEFLASKIIIDSVNEFDNTKFSEAEISKITLHFEALRKSFETLESTTKEQNTYVNEKLDYIIERLNHLGKRDWLGIAFTGAFSIWQVFLTNPEIANRVLEFYREHLPFISNLPKLLTSH